MLSINWIINWLMILVTFLSVQSSDRLTIDIFEESVFVKQNITIDNDLIIIHVPAHRHLHEVEIYFDLKNNFQLTKIFSENKCQLSTVDSDMKHFFMDPNFHQAMPLNSSAMTHHELIRIESAQPLSNLSHLRPEMRNFCHDLPVFWIDTMDNDASQSSRNTPNTMSRNSLSCLYSYYEPGKPVKCHPDCFYQQCNPSGLSWCYYMTSHCPMVTSSCWIHVSNVQLNCRPCCSDPQIPCNADIPYCGCLGIPSIGR